MSGRPPIFGPHFTLRVALMSRGLSQREVASRMGVSSSYVSQMLKGQRTISPKFLNDFCDAAVIPEPERSGINLEAARFSGWRI